MMLRTLKVGSFLVEWGLLVALHKRLRSVHVPTNELRAGFRRRQLEPFLSVLVVVQILAPVDELLYLLLELLLVLDLDQPRIFQWIVSLDLVVAVWIDFLQLLLGALYLAFQFLLLLLLLGARAPGLLFILCLLVEVLKPPQFGDACLLTALVDSLFLLVVVVAHLIRRVQLNVVGLIEHLVADLSRSIRTGRQPLLSERRYQPSS